MKRWASHAILKFGFVAIAATPLAVVFTTVAQASDLQTSHLLAQETVTVLEQGSTGSAVKDVQAMLALMGYYSGAIDGVYAQATAEAVRKFQADAGLEADGVVGPVTWRWLLPTPASLTAPKEPIAVQPSPDDTAEPEQQATDIDPATLPVLRLDDIGPDVSRLQRLLEADRFYTGPVDGVFGPQTEQAVKQLQSQANLLVDGVVGSATWRYLLQ